MCRVSIKGHATISENELEISGIRAQGPGGQNVNKVSSAVQLRFDINASNSLSSEAKIKLLNHPDRRISKHGVVTIKAQGSRSRDKNRTDALQRLQTLIATALSVKKKRVATKPSKKAKQKRLDDKSRRSQLKRTRSKSLD